MMYIEIYEVLWTEATRISASYFVSKTSQRVFFDYGEAKQFEQKRIESGLNPEYIEFKVHKMPVRGGLDYPVKEISR